MNIEKIDKWLDDKYGISYTELVKIKEYLAEENKRLKDQNINEILKKDLEICAKQYKKSDEKVKKLEKRNKEIYEGFLATQEEMSDYAIRIDKAINKIQYIRDLGFDYDGFDNVKDLKGLIDELVDVAGQSIDILRGDKE